MKGAFIVFACSACRQKIFAERSQAGRQGKCPLCGAATVVGDGAAPPPRRPDDRRGYRRVPIANARVACETKTGEGRPVSAEEMPVLEDISYSGIGFVVKGEPDRKKLVGFAPPSWLRIGDSVLVVLHVPQLFRPRQVRAVVRRIAPISTRRELFRVGAEFSQASEEVLKDLKKLLSEKTER